ncbi:selenium metabolism-associated LysR family transcriptional regulator [Chloroflexota bacterium]
MNLNYLRTYLEVVKLGSFSEVARKLGISQPAVSFQIQKLEGDLGVRLLDRSQKAITMTEAGRRLLLFAESVEEERNRLRHDIDQLREEVTGNLIIASSTIPGEFMLPSLLARFKALHPAIRAEVKISDSLSVISGVRNGIYEVGFCGVVPEEQDLESFRVAEDEIALIVFPEHTFAWRGEVSLAELEEEPIIFREDTSGTQKSLQNLLDKAGFELRDREPHLILSTTQAVVSAVEAKAGIAFVSNLAIKKSLALGLVRQIKVKGLRLVREFYCIYRKDKLVSCLLEEFITFTKADSAHNLGEK